MTGTADSPRARPSRWRLARAAWAALGSVALLLAALALVLPARPAAPFVALAAACFRRSSQRLYDRLLAHRVFGPGARALRATDGVPRAVKWTALGTLALTACALFWGIPAGWRLAAGLLLLLGSVVALCVARLAGADP